MLTKKIILITILLIFLGCSNKKIGLNKERMTWQEEQFSRTQERYSFYYDIIYESDSLALTIQTDQQEFIQGEPLKIILSLKNISKEPLNVNDELELGYSTCPITLCLIDADGVYYDLYYGIHIDKGRNLKYEGYTIMPGDSIAVIVYPHFYNYRYFDNWRINYTDPGNYIIRALYNVSDRYELVWTGKVTSNDINIKIFETAGTEYEAFEMFSKTYNIFIMGDGMARFLHEPNHMNELNILNTVIDNYPNTVFAKYAMYYIAISYLDIDAKKSMKLLVELKELDPLFRVQEINLGLLRCYKTLEMHDEMNALIRNCKFDTSLDYERLYYFIY